MTPAIAANVAANVAVVYDSFPDAARDALMDVRSLIFQTAATNPAIGPLTETLKWGEPAYLTEATKSGSTIRIAWHKGKPDHIGMYLNCKTTLIDTMREIYPDTFTYQGTRAAMIDLSQPLPKDALAHCIEMALMYHRKRSG